jgi:integrase
LLTKSIPHTFVRNGYYYFSRRVPSDLRDHYSYHRIVQGLRTTSPQKARVQANIASAKLDAYWGQMRLAKSEVIGMSLVSSRPNDNLEAALGPSQPVCPSLLDALAVYLEYKGKGRPKTFRLAAERSCNYVIGLCGNKPLSQYTRQDALQFRDWLVARGLTGSSVTRNFPYLKAVINFALSEYALDVSNPFVGVYHDRSAGVLTRKPIPIEDIRKVQNQCRLIDDDLRWLVALVSDTGMRLAEGAGLLKSDIILDADIPYLSLKPHPWRSLKTSASERDIPLVGASLWAAQRLSEAFPGSPYAFPRYNRKDTTNSNSASAALNKWLHKYVPEGCTMHSFRHSMRDRLRAVQCSADIIDQIGGWTSEGVGQGYGYGYPLSVLYTHLSKLSSFRS